MDARQLEAFKAAYEAGSMAKAAEEVVITPQGLSRLICSLESELGGKLFIRTSQGVEPTELGRRAYPKAVKVLALMGAMHAGPSEAEEPVSVASVSGGLSYFGGAFPEDFAVENPGVCLHVEEGNDRHVTELVALGRVDCGVLSGSVDLDRFDARPIARHPHALIVQADDDLAVLAASRGDGSVELSDLQGRCVGIMGEGYSPYAYIRERMMRDGVDVAEFVGFAEVYTGVVRVRAEGLCVITTDFVMPPGSDGAFAVLPFRDKQFTWDEYLVTRRGEERGQGVAALWDFLPRWYANHERGLFPWRSPDGRWPLSCSRHNRGK